MSDAGLRALWLASPALPIGAYAYSRGLSQAIESERVHDGESAFEWIEALLQRQIARLDAPMLVRLYAAFSTADHEAVAHWCAELRAYRETAELALEDEQLGLALTRLLRGLSELGEVPVVATQSYVAMLAYAATRFLLPLPDALRVLFFSCAEAQVTVASKSLPLGQTDAQRVLSRLINVIPRCIESATTAHDLEIGSYLPGVAMASALHEVQYSRLYRS